MSFSARPLANNMKVNVGAQFACHAGNQAVLRQAVSSDIPSIHQVRCAVRENILSDPNRITEADYQAALEALGRTWIVTKDDSVVAFATGYNCGSIWALFVHPDQEGCGYGKALHAVVVAWLQSIGHQRIWLTTGPGTRAEHFYRSLGWQLSGQESNGDLRLELCIAPACDS